MFSGTCTAAWTSGPFMSYRPIDTSGFIGGSMDCFSSASQSKFLSHGLCLISSKPNFAPSRLEAYYLNGN